MQALIIPIISTYKSFVTDRSQHAEKSKPKMETKKKIKLKNNRQPFYIRKKKKKRHTVIHISCFAIGYRLGFYSQTFPQACHMFDLAFSRSTWKVLWQQIYVE